MSNELKFVFEAIKVVFLDANPQELIALYAECNEEALNKFSRNHSIRPLIYQACILGNIQGGLPQKLKEITVRMSLFDKLNGLENVRILNLFEREGVMAIPYKGYFYTETLYKGKTLRESSDIDLIIKGDVFLAISILEREGYVHSSDIPFDKTFANPNFTEVTLVRQTQQGFRFQIDFHWGLHEPYYSYNLSAEECLRGAQNNIFVNQVCLLPTLEMQFKMMLNHHGGRSYWLNLKEVLDFYLFIKNNPEIHNSLHNWAAEIKMLKIFNAGINLISKFIQKDVFFTDDRKVELSKEEKLIVSTWNIGENFKNNFKPKLARYYLLFRLQEQEVNRWKLMVNIIKFHLNTKKFK